MENMKNIKIRRRMTFVNEGIENMIVCKMACRPSAFPANRSTLVTLSTLMILAS